jgi:hypothetical protein
MKNDYFIRYFYLLLFICFVALIPASHVIADDDSICARVKFEIKQSLSLERQAFYAHMRVTNGLSHIPIENVNIDVVFTDENGNVINATSDPNNPDALFFIKMDSMENINAIDGTGSIQPSTTADINWLIIPTPGASKGISQGSLYYIGATLYYTMDNEEYTTEVSPDYIYIKPMPEIVLDYFFPANVYGDDAFTSEIEPSIPFSVGVRVSNTGSGIARNMKINSAQPKIIENQQGLLIGFNIENCEVNGTLSEPTLLANFSDINPHKAATARWLMTCTLSGQIVEFMANFTHSNELGGELTSLVTATNPHFLIQTVMVDIEGRDRLLDFLAMDGDTLRVYESENIDTIVTDQSSSSRLDGSANSYTLSTTPYLGFSYIKLSDPCSGQKIIREVIRSDGKHIKPENAWLSKIRNSNHGWDYYLNLFDVNSSEAYTVTFDDTPSHNNAPLLQFIPDQNIVEGNLLTFSIQATDADGTIPLLSANPLPALAAFTDQKDGTGIFRWPTTAGQAGQYDITFVASDGVLKNAQRVLISVRSKDDRDGDGILDAWEIKYFGTLDRDGTGDYDGDGISDMNEFLMGTDPTVHRNNGPTIPSIYTPLNGEEVGGFQPELIVWNSNDADGDLLTYEFEIYSDTEMTRQVTKESAVPQGITITSWIAPLALADNTQYFWRVRAYDGTIFSQWAYGSFFVNTANDPPGEFRISSPRTDTSNSLLEIISPVDDIVNTQTPTLVVTNSKDPDGDVVTYAFQVYANSKMTILVSSCQNITEGKNGSTSWTVDTKLKPSKKYYWKAIATDEHGATREILPASFVVALRKNTPVECIILYPSVGQEISSPDIDLVVKNASGFNWYASKYFFELDKVNTFDSSSLQTSGIIHQGNTDTRWHVTTLDENTLYYWRVKVGDGVTESQWVQGSFFVNTVNDSPSLPTVKNPGDNSWVDTRTPTLMVNPANDPDHDNLIYHFELYADPLSALIYKTESDVPTSMVPELPNNKRYYWRAQVSDEHGAITNWTEMATFYLKGTGVNNPP